MCTEYSPSTPITLFLRFVAFFLFPIVYGVWQKRAAWSMAFFQTSFFLSQGLFFSLTKQRGHQIRSISAPVIYVCPRYFELNCPNGLYSRTEQVNVEVQSS